MAFAPVFARPFSPAFDRHAVAVAAAADWWPVAGKTCVAAYQPKGAASLSASYTNLANPGTNDAAPGVAPSWASGTGWTFNGIDQYLLTGLSPTSDASWSAVVQFSGAPNETESALLGAPTALVISPGWWGKVRYFYAGGVTVSPRLASGVLGIAGRSGYRDGVADGTWGAGGWTDGELVIGARNSGGGIVWYIAATIQKIAIYSDTLSDTEMADLYTAMTA